MFKVTREEFGLTQSQLSEDWRELARTILSEEVELSESKILSLRKTVLEQEDLEGFHESELLQDNGFLLRSLVATCFLVRRDNYFNPRYLRGANWNVETALQLLRASYTQVGRGG